MPADCGVVVVAGGSGSRMGPGEAPKQFRPVAGKPVFRWCLDFFLAHPEVLEVVLVVPRIQSDLARDLTADCDPERLKLVAGGARRQDSVSAGLEALGPDCKMVAVHDAARPFPPTDFSGLLKQARDSGGAIFALPVTDSIKRGDGSTIRENVSREHLWAAQTPQVFQTKLLRDCLQACNLRGIEVTDDASALQELGHPVRIVEGSRSNLKITLPEDWVLAEALAAGRGSEKR